MDTRATRRIFSLKKKIRAVSGGTAASKTISILVWLIDYSQSTKNKVVTVVSESYPHLEGGCIRDFKNIMKLQGYWQDGAWNETKHIYTFSEGTIIEFKSIDKFGKAHGPRRDVLFINEANNLEYRIADQLITRTREVAWMDWNPSAEFWFYTEMWKRRDDIEFMGDGGNLPPLTFLDNEALDKNTIHEIEAHRDNKNWWKVYGLGLLGDVEGKIYKDWLIIDDISHHARLERRGLDFGYSNDPSAIVSIYYYDGGYIIDEELYQRGMLNKPLADFILNSPNANTLVVADSAEPKSIAEIKSYGVNIIGVSKTKGESNSDNFVKWSIGLVQSQRISITKRSINTIKEYRTAMWLTDKDGKILNEEDPKFPNHGLAASRYGFVSILGKPKVKINPPTAPAPMFYPELGI